MVIAVRRVLFTTFTAVILLTGCGTSAPSPMQKWQAGPGGKCLAQVEKDLTAVGSAQTIPDVSSESAVLWKAALDCTSYPPPAGGARFAQVMAGISATSMFMVSYLTDGSSAAGTDAKRGISSVKALLSNAPSADTWAPGLKAAYG